MWTLLSRQTTELYWKKTKRRISIWTNPGNWKNWGTWRLCQFSYMRLVQSSKNKYRDWRTLKWKDKCRPSKLLHYWIRPEYRGVSWRLEETWCLSNSSEKPSANAGVKNSKSNKKKFRLNLFFWGRHVQSPFSHKITLFSLIPLDSGVR